MKKTMWLVVLLVLGGIAAGFYYWQMHQQQEPPPPRVETPPAPAAKTEPSIRYPIQETPSPEKPLPSPGESDAAMQDALAGLFTRKSAEELFDLKEIVRRFVVTVDNLPRKKVPMRYRLFKPVLGQFPVTGEGEELPQNPGENRG